MDFKTLGVVEEIRKALTEKEYSTPTPIQEQAIPIILDKSDLQAIAQTGTGKTAAFAIPIIQNLFIDKKTNKSNNIKCLILTPTRELAIQIFENIRFYGKYTKLKSVVIFGGVKQTRQVDALKKNVDILIATPGRLLDLIDQGFINLDKINTFVLDEADRMLDMGFLNDVKKIIKMLPQSKQSLLFSATMPSNITDLAKSILINPKYIAVTPKQTTAETLEQKIFYTNKSTKINLLEDILRNKEIDQALIFVRTKHGSDKIVRQLIKKNISAAAIHGNKSQNYRQKVLNDFKNNNLRVLIATDIAARGIDINELYYIINYEIPNIPETYVHRIGRAGRAGKRGLAISICEPEELAYVRSIEKLIGFKIEEDKNHNYPQTDKPMTKEEKKQYEKEKLERKKEFFANRRQKRR